MKGDGRRRPIGPRAGHRQLQRRGPGLSVFCCTFGLDVAVEREPAARERLEVMGPRSTGDEHQLLASGGTHEQLHRTLGLTRLEQCTG